MKSENQARTAKADDTQGQAEYRLAVETQMHFNQILMRFRSFGISVVVAIYSYAVTRPPSDIAVEVCGLRTAPSQVIAIAGIVLALILAIIDIGYFFQLLLGAVDRSLALEASINYRLTSAICHTVSRKRSYVMVILFYAAIVVAGVCLLWILPSFRPPLN